MIETPVAAGGTGARPSRRHSLLVALLGLCAAIGVPPAARAVEPPVSWVRFELDVPLEMVREQIERRLPPEAQSRRVRLAEGYDLEVHAKRQPFKVEARHDSLVVRTRLEHTLHVSGKDLERTGCGSEAAPLMADLVVRARWGWDEAWGLEAIATPEGLNFARRCKPDPPKINLVKRCQPAMQEMCIDPLLEAVPEIAASVKSREFLTAVWDALAGGSLLADGWIDFAPEAVFVEPIGFTPRAVAIRGAVRVRSAARTGAKPAAKPAFPSSTPTRVRLAGGQFGLMLTVRSGLEAMRTSFQAALDSLAPGEYVVRKLTPQPQADGAHVVVELEGKSTGGRILRSPLEYRNHPPGVVARSPSWTEASPTVMAQSDPARKERLDDILATAARSLRLDLNDRVAVETRNLSANLQRRIGEGLLLDGVLNDRELIALGVESDQVSVALALTGRAVIRPVATSP